MTVDPFSQPSRLHPLRRRRVNRERAALFAEASRAYIRGIQRFGLDHRQIRMVVVRAVGSDVAAVYYSLLDQRIAR